jgi:hypothetical protein
MEECPFPQKVSILYPHLNEKETPNLIEKSRPPPQLIGKEPFFDI